MNVWYSNTAGHTVDHMRAPTALLPAASVLSVPAAAFWSLPGWVLIVSVLTSVAVMLGPCVVTQILRVRASLKDPIRTLEIETTKINSTVPAASRGKKSKKKKKVQNC